MLNVEKGKKVRVGKEIILEEDYEAYDENGEKHVAEKGSVGYVTNYCGLIFENGITLVGVEELENDREIDKPGFAAYLYRTLSENLPLDKMLASCSLSEDDLKKVILDELNKLFINSEELDELEDFEEVEDNDDSADEIDFLKYGYYLYIAISEKLQPDKILESCEVSEEQFLKAIFFALDSIIYAPEVLEKDNGKQNIDCSVITLSIEEFNLLDAKKVRVGEKVVIDEEIEYEDEAGNNGVIKEGTVGYVTNYCYVIFEDEKILKVEKISYAEGIDKPGITDYLYQFLSGKLSLDQMLKSFDISEDAFKKVILDRLNYQYFNDDEIEKCDAPEDLENFEYENEYGKIAIVEDIYNALAKSFPLKKMLRSLKISKKAFKGNILIALDYLIIDSDEAKNCFESEGKEESKGE